MPYRRLQLQTRQKIDKISKKLRQRLSLNNIHNEIQLISCMNKHLEIAIDCMKKIEILSQLTKVEILQVVNAISFLKVFRKNNQGEYVRLEYENAHKLLLVTGIQKQFVEEIVLQFNSYNRRQIQQSSGKSPNARVIHSNVHWVTIETSSEEAAALLKKCLRNEKRNLDSNPAKHNYKIERRRIRIVIVKEDLFTLLIDAMTQCKAQMFQKNFILLPSQSLERRKSQQLSNGVSQVFKSHILYRPLLYNNLQNFNKNDQKQQQFSDGFSESNSLNSEIIDASKMKDIIETSDQGIQSQNNGFIQNQQPLTSGSLNHSPSRPRSIQNKDSKKTQQKDSKPQGLESVHIASVNEDKDNLLGKDVTSPEKLSISNQNQDLLCTQKHSPVYKKGQFSRNVSFNGQICINFFKESYCQTQQGLYSVLSNAQMRRLMQQFKNRNHSELVQLPEWMKSESQNERNRHRFFSSLCKPKLIRQRKIE